MLPTKSKWIALLGIAIAASGVSFAQSVDNQALIKKGVLTDAEAKEITAQVAKDQSAEDVETSGDQYIKKVILTGRFQPQYVGLGTSIDGNLVNPVSTEHFLVRRIYVKLQAGYIRGESNDTIAGSTVKAATDGVRSQVQVNF